MRFWKAADREAQRVRVSAIGLAVLMHAGLGLLILTYAPDDIYEEETQTVSVALVTLPPEPDPEPIIEPEIQPAMQPQPRPVETSEPPKPPKVEVTPVPNPEPAPAPAPIPSPSPAEPATPSILQNDAPSSDPGGLSAPPNPNTSDAANDARISEAMAGLGRDLACLRSTDEACRQNRNYILEEFQLTETQKVWTSNRSDTGLPSAYYGLSEREIMKKLNVAVRGENDMMIPFTNIGLQGSWADALHGAKGKCEFKVGGNNRSEDGIGGFDYGATGRAFGRNCEISNERPSPTGPAWGE